MDERKPVNTGSGKRRKSGVSRIKNITENVNQTHNAGENILPVKDSKAEERRPRKKPAVPGQLNHQPNRSPRPRKKRKNKKKRLLYRIAALILMLTVAVVGFITIKNYGSGSSSNQKGLNAYNVGNYEEAIALFSEALSYDNRNPEYFINLGMAQAELKKYDAALESFDLAITNTHKTVMLQKARRGKGIVYLYQGEYDEAINQFKESLADSGNHYSELEIDILYYLAEAQDKSGDSVGAVLSYTEIINSTDEAVAYMLRGLAYQNVGDNTNAEADLLTALEKSEKNYKVYLTLYNVLIAQDKESKALEILQEALALKSRNGEDYANKGMIYLYLEDFENAQAAFDTAREKDYNGACLGLAETAKKQKDYEGALSYYESYLAVDQSSASAYNQYGVCLMKLSRYEEALTAFETGLQLNDRTAEAELMFNEATVYSYLTQWQVSYEKMKAYVEKYPDDEAAVRELAFLESRQGNP